MTRIVWVGAGDLDVSGSGAVHYKPENREVLLFGPAGGRVESLTGIWDWARRLLIVTERALAEDRDVERAAVVAAAQAKVAGL
jgi:hypothetical protein